MFLCYNIDMQSINELLLSRVKKDVSPFTTVGHNLYEQYQDLCGSPSYKQYYISVFNKLGKQTVIRLAASAKVDARQPANYFGKLVRDAVSKKYQSNS